MKSDLIRSRPGAFEIKPASAPGRAPRRRRHLAVARALEQLPRRHARGSRRDQHRDGLRVRSPPPALRRGRPGPGPVHPADPGPRRPRRRRRHVPRAGHPARRAGEQPDLPGRRRAHPPVPGAAQPAVLGQRDRGRRRVHPEPARRTRRSRPSRRPLRTCCSTTVTSSSSAAPASSASRLPGGETIDSTVVWLPDRGIAFVGNVFSALFGHFPNLVTLRADRLRFALPFVDAVQRGDRPRARDPLHRSLRPDRGSRHDPHRAHAGARRGAVRARRDGRRDERGQGRLHADARDPAARRARGRRGLRQGLVGRALDLGGLRRAGSTPARRPSCTRTGPDAVWPEVVALAGGPDAIVAAAPGRLDSGDAIGAVQLCEMALAAEPGPPRRARDVRRRARGCSSPSTARRTRTSGSSAGSTTRSRPPAGQLASRERRRHRRRGREQGRAPRPGLDDLGDPAWRDGLDVLLDSVEHEAELNDVGRMILRTWIHERLVNRLRLTDWVARAPRSASRADRAPDRRGRHAAHRDDAALRAAGVRPGEPRRS